MVRPSAARPLEMEWVSRQYLSQSWIRVRLPVPDSGDPGIALRVRSGGWVGGDLFKELLWGEVEEGASADDKGDGEGGYFSDFHDCFLITAMGNVTVTPGCCKNGQDG